MNKPYCALYEFADVTLVADDMPAIAPNCSNCIGASLQDAKQLVSPFDAHAELVHMPVYDDAIETRTVSREEEHNSNFSHLMTLFESKVGDDGTFEVSLRELAELPDFEGTYGPEAGWFVTNGLKKAVVKCKSLR